MLADYHVHTAFSDDSDYPLPDVVRDAAAMGMEELCLTDHVDYGVKVDPDSGQEIPLWQGYYPLANTDYPKYAAAIGEARALYGDRIRIKMGLEFGMQVHTIPQYEALFRRYPFDFILLSIHQVEDKTFWNQAFQQGRTQEEAYLRYYGEMLELVRRYKNYSVLGHVDHLARYDKGEPFPFEKVKPILTDIFRQVIADGKGVELNTSYRRYGQRDTTPARPILELYRDLGGRVLTIGSDSHKPEHLGAYISEGMALLKELGFREFCTYEKMEPIFHPL